MKVKFISLPSHKVVKKIEIKIKNYDSKSGGDIFDDLDKDEVVKPKVKLRSLFDSNTYMDVKRYIAVNEGIPIEYQLLECKINNQWQVVTHTYEPKDSRLKHIRYPLDIREVQESNIAGIPIDLNLVNNRHNYNIKDLSFKKLKNGNVRIYDLREVMAIEEVGKYISKDDDNRMIFYTGFVEKFFPMVLYEDFQKPPSWKLFTDSIIYKIDALEDLSKNRRKAVPEYSFNSINLKYTHVGTNIVNILKSYNAIDLVDVNKVEAYISRSNKFLMKIPKDEFSEELTETTPSRSYIKIFLEEVIVKIFDNNDIEASVSKKDASKSEMISIYKKALSEISSILKWVIVDTAKQHSEIVSVSCYTTYNSSPNIERIKRIRNLITKYENCEDYKYSSAVSHKDDIVLYISKGNLMHGENEYSTLKMNIASGKPLFVSASNIKIIPRIQDFVVEFNNVSSRELEQRMKFISIIMSEAGSSSVKSIVDSRSKLKILKSTDPVLFDQEGMNYSRLCQSNQQPIITKKSDKTVKFWNFTKGEVAYYSCDSKKFPHLKFITGQHPNGFCLPCCKMKAVEKSTQYKEKHKQCLNNYSFENRDQNQEKISRYIATYSCRVELEPGQLMKLSSTLSKFFRSRDTYILGIAPFKSVIVNYTLTCMSLIMFEDYNRQIDVLFAIHDAIKNDHAIFYMLLEGSLVMYFEINTFLDFIKNLTTGIEVTPKWISYIDWEVLFKECASYMGIGISYILEEDNGSVKDSQIFLDQCTGNFQKHMIILRRKKTVYYPIVLASNTFNLVKDIRYKKPINVKDTEENPIVLASFLNDRNQIFAQCIESKFGKILKTVEYTQSVKFKDTITKLSIDEYIRSNDILSNTVDKIARVEKWIKKDNLSIAVSPECLFFSKFDKNREHDIYRTDTAVPTRHDVKKSIYFTNMYNLLMLHVGDKLGKTLDMRMRKKIADNIKKRELLSKILDEDDYLKIMYLYDSTGNLKFMESMRFNFDDSEKINLESIVKIGKPNFDLEIDESLGLCTNTEYYCDGKKFILQEPKYLNMIQKDLENPYKKKFIQMYNEISRHELYIKEYKNSKTIIYDGLR